MFALPGVVNQLSITIGILIVQAFGLLFDDSDRWWELINLISLAPSLGCFAAAYFGPESPRWLVNQGRRDEAGASLQRLRGAGSWESIEAELNEIIQAVERVSACPRPQLEPMLSCARALIFMS